MAIRVLLIDPDIPFIVSIKQALENTGEFAVTVSAHGLAAQDMLRRQNHDIAVVGFDVPDMDMMEMISVLRAIQPHLPLIVAPRTPEHQERVRYLDVQGAITKPFSARDLIPYVRSVLARLRRRPDTSDLAEDRPVSPSATRRLAEPEPPEQTHTVEWQDVDQTSTLGDTSTLDDEFGDVLDAITQHPREEVNPTPDDRAFQNLVDSLSSPGVKRTGRASLDELLNSLAADTPEEEMPPGNYLNVIDNALDYVLDAIRRGAPLTPPVGTSAGTPNAEPLDEATIGDAINDLFDPSFEGVLAALAGEPVDESEYAEPTYDTEGRTPASEGGEGARDHLDVEDAEWRTAYESENVSPRHAVDEPPITLEDSSGFPATAALNAITDLEDSGGVSLTDLLSQIEGHLPDTPGQPHLKPLPSWEQQQQEKMAEKMANMFDRLEGPPPSSSPFTMDPDFMPEDTRPSQAILDEIARVPFQETDTTRAGLPRLSDEEQPAYDDSDLAVPDELAIPPEVEELQDSPPLEGVRESLLSMEDLLALADLPMEVQPGGEPDLPPLEVPSLDDNSLVAMPVETAARLLSGDFQEDVPEEPEPEPEPDTLAHIAVQLTQFALESSAQAVVLSQPGMPLAQAGNLTIPASQRLFQVIETAWQTSTNTSNALIRFITLPDLGEFLLYSTMVEEDLFLSMLFGADTPVHTIRRQASRLSQSLALVPEEPAADRDFPEESEAAATSPSRPTDMRPPEGLYGAVADHLADRRMETEPPPDVVRPNTPYAAYTCLWLPYDPSLELIGELAEALIAWIRELAASQAWDVNSVDVPSDTVQLTIHVPIKTLPDQAIQWLMDETTARCAEVFPDVTDGSVPLWANGYYVVTPPRDLADREIARFITYQRQAQLG